MAPNRRSQLARSRGDSHGSGSNNGSNTKRNSHSIRLDQSVQSVSARRMVEDISVCGEDNIIATTPMLETSIKEEFHDEDEEEDMQYFNAMYSPNSSGAKKKKKAGFLETVRSSIVLPTSRRSLIDLSDKSNNNDMRSSSNSQNTSPPGHSTSSFASSQSALGGDASYTSGESSRRRSSLMEHMQHLYHGSASNTSATHTTGGMIPLSYNNAHGDHTDATEMGDSDHHILGMVDLEDSERGLKAPRHSGMLHINTSRRQSKAAGLCGSSSDEETSLRMKRRKRRICGLVVCLLLVAIIATTLALTLAPGNSNGSSTTPEGPGFEDLTNMLDVSQVPQTSRQDALLFLLQDQAVSDSDVIEDDFDSPAALALKWISDEDTAQWDIPGFDAPVNNVETLRSVLQRYALAVLFFTLDDSAATAGVGSNEEQNGRQRRHLLALEQGKPTCVWSGVTCKNRLVVALDLSSRMLQGTLPRELFSGAALPALTSLDLSHNNLEGTLEGVATQQSPTGSTALGVSLPKLVPLEELKLNNNGLRGSMEPILGLTNIGV